MTRSVADAAVLLSVIAGKDPNDNFTHAQPAIVPDFSKALNKGALKGKRSVSVYFFLFVDPVECIHCGSEE